MIGALIATYSVFPMLLAIFAGKLSDRVGVRVPMLCGSAGLALGLLLPFLYPRLPMLYASAALLGASQVFYNVSMQSLIGSLSSAAHRTRNFSNYGLIMALGGFVGPLAAGVSIDHAGYARTYLFMSLAPLVSILMLLSARSLGRVSTRSREAPAPGGKGKGLLTSGPLRRTLITSAAILTGIDLFQFYLPIYGYHVGLSASAIGVVLSMFGAASFVVRMAIPRLARRWREEELMTQALFVGAVTYVMFPLFESAAALAAVAFLLGLGLGLGQPLSLMLIYSNSPQGRTGEALGLRMSINNFTHIIVPVVFGALGTALGVAPVFFANAAMLAGSGAISWRKHARDE
jgi:MFS family permease